jgi:hypothetical protein
MRALDHRVDLIVTIEGDAREGSGKEHGRAAIFPDTGKRWQLNPCSDDLERFSIVLNRDVLAEDSQIGWNERFCAG